MEKQLIGRGVLSGAIAGLVMFVFARIFAEPIIQKAIDYESARDAAQDALDKAAGKAIPAAGPDIFSRTIQGNLGIGAGLILFGAAMGALVAVAYIICIGRTGRIRPRPLGYLVPAFFFVGVYLVPFIKYPSNPPAIGHEETIRTRGALYLILVFCSCLFLFLAVYVGQKLHRRWSVTTSAVLVGIGYLAVMTVIMLILPALGHLHANVVEYGKHATETPLPLTDEDGTIVFPGFPADVLAQFRAYSVGAQVILWGVMALVFAPLAERVLAPVARTQRTTATSTVAG
ncbi:MAG: CbtA family protein [Nocardioides sp.]|uniref:CbtA family protein n=1 Tax=Nocardioides sp. TaxID=35761 RepID=UPI0039E61B9C